LQQKEKEFEIFELPIPPIIEKKERLDFENI
jgi:hypothetical protein